ncbi:MAG TPA: type II toxin-antitoxin system VapC family toxin [bacterium]|nr:type II toxin-antitoxin system VapC family toxin [bacterium]HOH09336.1 type II toxin-antitoxin system VapC family toxin [bacterium]HOY43417.1 type II toxin-antitoxin system VapC family toxin [bacterium]HPG83203.1 type II toxin-antitoxin system VapC family toxin [bacterium]HPM58291.1 type II toxin-antitoxin system VapC family toxin [bacterium]
MIVVDSQLIAALLLNNEKTDLAREVLRRDDEWIAPLLWRSEFRQLLAFYLRKKVLTLRQASLIMQEAESLMQGGQFEIPSLDILTVTEKYDCSAYAAEYIALAQEQGVPLVTMDKMYLRKFPAVTMNAESFISMKITQEQVHPEML